MTTSRARSVTTGDVLILGTRGFYLRQVELGVRTYCQQHGLSWRILWLQPQDFQAFDQVGFLDSRPLLGALGMFTKEQLAWLAARGLPGVSLRTGAPPTDQPITSIHLDDHAIGLLAARFFAERGYRHLGLIGRRGKATRENRFNGVIEHAREVGMAVHQFTGDNTEHPVEGMAEWLRGLPKPLATFHFVDGAAAWFAEFCRHKGFRVPDEIAILGVNDEAYLVERDGARLSSIVLPLAHIGSLAALSLHRMACSPSAPIEHRVVPPLFVRERDSTHQHAPDNPLLDTLIKRLDATLTADWTPETMAGTVGCSRATLYRLCHDSIHQTPMALVRRRRLVRAQSLLLRGDAPVAEVAAQCGFPSLSAFSKAFRTHIGLTPTQFRAGGRIDASLPAR